MREDIEQLQSMVDASSRIVFFGGAGVSVASGIPDFRSSDGLYSQKYNYPPETILSRSFFITHTREFFAFYFDKVIHAKAQPNPAHIALASWEEAGCLTAVITQNIDGLHQAAGSHIVWELHGTVHKNTCLDCGMMYTLDEVISAHNQSPDGIPRCPCGSVIEPDVVLYEDPLDPYVLDEAATAIDDADMMLVGGTSLVVVPAARLVNYFRGNRLAVINKDGSGGSAGALTIAAPIEEVLPQIRVSPR